ncbi:NAD-dependent epimerase/dehydratase [Thermocrinis albus DSM 14484]|uniref:NAD-dependent epimerase/dehydratase n=1 Tax=Thermocrinis albus (strain DSM 14484 / JCM 11386 / HI 11/12) TaxID=638303 RepID=D3SLJ9_THEAH|nr:GDP-mannose 4,6-dehydratase [Thermocrinis albus]ADC89629.1 NAD-dependent epimerase/dehydratase [Thermocrinis albus DSM 14484]
MPTILVTGCAGFIGWKVSQKLLEKGFHVVGIDNLNHYYDVRLKWHRLENLKRFPSFVFYQVDVENMEALSVVFQVHKFDAVINEAARAGVRSSMEDPFVYMRTNALGTLHLLDLCKRYGVQKFVLASTSSLYAGQSMPFREDLPVNTPISPYAASKKAAEVIAYTYHYLYGIDVTVLRYFTVYGPAGRPDMSVFRFIKWALEGKPIQVFGDGSQKRDFTYIDDIAEGTVRALTPLGYQIINLGGNRPHSLLEVIDLVEKYTGKKVQLQYGDFHKADMQATWADIGKAKDLLGWEPQVSLEEGIRRTVEWFLENWDWLREITV